MFCSCYSNGQGNSNQESVRQREILAKGTVSDLWIIVSTDVADEAGTIACPTLLIEGREPLAIAPPPGQSFEGGKTIVAHFDNLEGFTPSDLVEAKLSVELSSDDAWLPRRIWVLARVKKRESNSFDHILTHAGDWESSAWLGNKECPVPVGAGVQPVRPLNIAKTAAKCEQKEFIKDLFVIASTSRIDSGDGAGTSDDIELSISKKIIKRLPTSERNNFLLSTAYFDQTKFPDRSMPCAYLNRSVIFLEITGEDMWVPSDVIVVSVSDKNAWRVVVNTQWNPKNVFSTDLGDKIQDGNVSKKYDVMGYPSTYNPNNTR